MCHFVIFRRVFGISKSTDARLHLVIRKCAFGSKGVSLPEVDVRILNRAAVHPLKSSYKGQLIWACYTGGRDMKVSQPSAELINLCLNEATHLSLCALTTAHHSPPSHYTCAHRSVTKLEFWVTDVREFFFFFHNHGYLKYSL